MLSWVILSVVGGRLLLRIGYRTISLTGFVILTAGFVFLAMFERETPRFWLYLDLVLIGAGLGLTMLTLLIAVQQAVDRTKLGVATSLNQFSRAIGGAFGVAIMGAVLTAGLSTELNNAAQSGKGDLSPAQAEQLASNPNALIDEHERESLPNEIFEILQQAMAVSIHRVFWVGAVLSFLALIVAFWLPKQTNEEIHKTDESAGEKTLIAEKTTINARSQPRGITEG
jgi:MFS family permease